MAHHIGTPAIKIRGLAAERGLTQEDIGVIIGHTRHYVGKRYRGTLDFSSSELEKIASYFGVSVGHLYGEQS
jgi:transcriptional regulator with XRE-family HTH domain